MAYEMKDNSGSLFKNDRKEQPNHPDYRGSAMVNGVEFWMSAWIKNADDPNKKTFMSFSFQPKEERQERYQAQNAAPEIDDEIPF